MTNPSSTSREAAELEHVIYRVLAIPEKSPLEFTLIQNGYATVDDILEADDATFLSHTYIDENVKVEDGQQPISKSLLPGMVSQLKALRQMSAYSAIEGYGHDDDPIEDWTLSPVTNFMHFRRAILPRYGFYIPVPTSSKPSKSPTSTATNLQSDPLKDFKKSIQRDPTQFTSPLAFTQTHSNYVGATGSTDSDDDDDGSDYSDVPSSAANVKEHSNSSSAALDTGMWIGHNAASRHLIPTSYTNARTTSATDACKETRDVDSDKPLATAADGYFVGDDVACPGTTLPTAVSSFAPTATAIHGEQLTIVDASSSVAHPRFRTGSDLDFGTDSLDDQLTRSYTHRLSAPSTDHCKGSRNPDVESEEPLATAADGYFADDDSLEFHDDTVLDTVDHTADPHVLQFDEHHALDGQHKFNDTIKSDDTVDALKPSQCMMLLSDDSSKFKFNMIDESTPSLHVEDPSSSFCSAECVLNPNLDGSELSNISCEPTALAVPTPVGLDCDIASLFDTIADRLDQALAEFHAMASHDDDTNNSTDFPGSTGSPPASCTVMSITTTVTKKPPMTPAKKVSLPASIHTVSPPASIHTVLPGALGKQLPPLVSASQTAISTLTHYERFTHNRHRNNGMFVNHEACGIISREDVQTLCLTNRPFDNDVTKDPLPKFVRSFHDPPDGSASSDGESSIAETVATVKNASDTTAAQFVNSFKSHNLFVYPLLDAIRERGAPTMLISNRPLRYDQIHNDATQDLLRTFARFSHDPPDGSASNDGESATTDLGTIDSEQEDGQRLCTRILQAFETRAMGNEHTHQSQVSITGDQHDGSQYIIDHILQYTTSRKNGTATYGSNIAPINWFSQQQGTIATATYSSEVIDVGTRTDRSIHLHGSDSQASLHVLATTDPSIGVPDFW